MNLQTYEEILEMWENRKPNERIWSNELAIQYNFPSSEALRSSFRRMRKNFNKENIEQQEINKKTNLGGAKVLIFDLEFAPMLCYSFDLWDQNIGINQIVSDSFMLSWAAKYLNESKVYFDVLTSEEAVAGDDLRITKSIWELLNNCDVVVGHNIRSFDLLKLNVRILNHNLLPIRKSQIIDTLLIARKNFSFPSNALKYVNRFLKIKEKIQNEGFDLWSKCMDGDEKALKIMDDYCRGDILAEEDLYYKLRPFISNHPNLALYFDTNEERCPNCGSTELKNEGFYYTPSGKWISLRCECGAISRSKQNELTATKRKSLKVN